jgi:hypothetical protein
MEASMTEDTVLRQVRRLSQPFKILLTIALGLFVLVQVGSVGTILFFHGGDAFHAAVGASADGIGLSVWGKTQPPGVPLDSLSFAQRSALALMAAVCSATVDLAIFNLRQLFALYSRGEVFARRNITHIKWFGLWLAGSGVLINVADRLFPMITGEPSHGFANALMAVVYGGMTWVVARVMELGRQADVERREFI